MYKYIHMMIHFGWVLNAHSFMHKTVHLNAYLSCIAFEMLKYYREKMMNYIRNPQPTRYLMPDQIYNAIFTMKTRAQYNFELLGWIPSKSNQQTNGKKRVSIEKLPMHQ